MKGHRLSPPPRPVKTLPANVAELFFQRGPRAVPHCGAELTDYARNVPRE